MRLGPPSRTGSRQSDRWQDGTPSRRIESIGGPIPVDGLFWRASLTGCVEPEAVTWIDLPEKDQVFILARRSSGQMQRP